MNKKGIMATRKIIFMIIAVIMLGMMIISVYYALTAYEEGRLHIAPETIEAIYAYRFLNVCFAHEDGITGRTDSGLIDLEKFTNESMAECYDASKEDYQFLLRLDNRSVSVKSTGWFNIIDNTIIKNVRVFDRGNISEDTMFIYVQRKR